MVKHHETLLFAQAISWMRDSILYGRSLYNRRIISPVSRVAPECERDGAETAWGLGSKRDHGRTERLRSSCHTAGEFNGAERQLEPNCEEELPPFTPTRQHDFSKNGNETEPTTSIIYRVFAFTQFLCTR